MHDNPVIDSLPYFVSSDLPLIKATYTLLSIHQEDNSECFAKIFDKKIKHIVDMVQIDENVCIGVRKIMFNPAVVAKWSNSPCFKLK